MRWPCRRIVDPAQGRSHFAGPDRRNIQRGREPAGPQFRRRAHDHVSRRRSAASVRAHVSDRAGAGSRHRRGSHAAFAQATRGDARQPRATRRPDRQGRPVQRVRPPHADHDDRQGPARRDSRDHDDHPLLDQGRGHGDQQPHAYRVGHADRDQLDPDQDARRDLRSSYQCQKCRSTIESRATVAPGRAVQGRAAASGASDCRFPGRKGTGPPGAGTAANVCAASSRRSARAKKPASTRRRWGCCSSFPPTTWPARFCRKCEKRSKNTKAIRIRSGRRTKT